MANKGREALSNAELLAILIGNGTRSKSAVDLSRDILMLAENDLNKLAKLGIKELRTINGIGPAKAITIIASIELGGRRKTAEKSTEIIRSSNDAASIFQPMLQDKDYEEFWILLLKKNNEIIKPYKISEGGVALTVADPKKIFRAALEFGASAVILCHNHPSGNLSPSPADFKLTEKLVKAGKNIDISVLDHIIVTNQGYYSFVDEGKL